MEETKDLCRLCLFPSDNNMTELFGDDKIYELVKECIGMQINENSLLPSSICNQCLCQLNNIQQFVTSTRRTQSYLMQVLIDCDNISQSADFDDNLDFEFLTGDDDAVQALALTLANPDKTVSNTSDDDSYLIHMEIDVLDSDLQVVSDLLGKNITNGMLVSPEKPSAGSSAGYSCMYCKSSFDDFNLLTKHMIMCDRRDGKTTFNNTYDDTDKNKEDVPCIYRCKYCKKIFISRTELYSHAKNHIKVKDHADKKFRCQICGDYYPTQMTLKQHHRSRHPDRDLNISLYRCKVCQTTFSDRKLLYSHVKQHTSVLETSGHLCDACGRSFNSHATLSRHALTHANELFECQLCSKKFATETLLKDHDKIHNAEKKMCDMCGIIVSNEASLKVHLSSHV